MKKLIMIMVAIQIVSCSTTVKFKKFQKVSDDPSRWRTPVSEVMNSIQGKYKTRFFDMMFDKHYEDLGFEIRGNQLKNYLGEQTKVIDRIRFETKFKDYLENEVSLYLFRDEADEEYQLYLHPDNKIEIISYEAWEVYRKIDT